MEMFQNFQNLVVWDLFSAHSQNHKIAVSQKIMKTEKWLRACWKRIKMNFLLNDKFNFFKIRGAWKPFSI